jgi:hypothetical protein
MPKSRCTVCREIYSSAAPLIVLLAALALSHAGVSRAETTQPVVCGGAAMQGGAQLMCSHTDPDKPTQYCTFSWDLMRSDNSAQVVQGSFLIPPGAANVQVYQGSGFASQITTPIVICRGKKSGSADSDD